MNMQNSQQCVAGGMPDKLKQGTTVIIDNCFYSRIAIEALLTEVYPSNNIYLFECVTDYKNWDHVESTVPDDCSIILNTSSSPLYGEDVTSFLWYEKRRAETDPGRINRRILLLSRSNCRVTCLSTIMTHCLRHVSSLPQLTVVDNVRELPRQELMTILRQFITGKNSLVSRYYYQSAVSRREKLSANEIRAIQIILSGKQVSYWASVYGVNPKTLYSQRTAILSLLGLAHRNEGFIYFSQQPEFLNENIF